MKELSIEEKAKAYDEAYKRVAIRFGSNVADELFPELKESEDEKIRQFLIREVTETSDKIMSYRNMNKKDVLAWLEKQGEQKSAWSEEDERSKNAAIQACKGMIDYFENSTKQYEDAIDWLKSLKKRIGE